MTDGELKTVAEYEDRISAHITAGYLNENGIPAAVFGEDSTYPSLSFLKKVEVKVNAEDYEAAKALVDEAEQAADQAMKDARED